MIIYECDMCGKQFREESRVSAVSTLGEKKGDDLPFGDNIDHFMVCRDCSREIGDFIRGYKARMKGLNCSVDTKFGGSGGKA